MKVQFEAKGPNYRIRIPSSNIDLLALSHVFEREGLTVKIVTPKIAVFDLNGSEISILRKGELVIRDTDTKKAKTKAAKLVTLLSQSLGIDFVLDA
jgi:ABC-type uncharacterized transport system ATPase subunit